MLLLINIFRVLELSGLLGGLIKIFSAWGEKKLLGCCLLGVDQADTMNVIERHVRLACWFRDY